jgi:hypothetical protein
MSQLRLMGNVELNNKKGRHCDSAAGVRLQAKEAESPVRGGKNPPDSADVAALD